MRKVSSYDLRKLAMEYSRIKWNGLSVQVYKGYFDGELTWVMNPFGKGNIRLGRNLPEAYEHLQQKYDQRKSELA